MNKPASSKTVPAGSHSSLLAIEKKSLKEEKSVAFAPLLKAGGTYMVKYPEPDHGCDVCGTVLPAADPGSYLRLEGDDQIFGQVCSWLCAIQFSASKLEEQRKILRGNNQELRRENGDLKEDSRLLNYYRAGVL